MALVVVATLTAPQLAHPDFSGQWTLDTPSPAPPDAARLLVVDQPVLRTNVRGEPIPPMYLHLSVRREGPSGTTTDTYTIGTIGGVVGGIPAGGRPTWSTHFETAWRGDTLTFLTRRDGPDGPHAGEWSERSELWSLDSDRRLRVEIETEAHDRAQQRTVLLYRRE